MVMSQRDNSPSLLRATEDKLRESSGWTHRLNVHIMHAWLRGKGCAHLRRVYALG